MIKIVLIVGGAATFAVFLVTVISGIDSADRDGRIPMPGEKALTLDAGDYGVYYEEAVETGENETFEPPDGIRIRVRGIGGAPDPELDLGGLGSQIGTDNRTAEEIGTLKVSEDGRYGVLVGPASGVRPTITIGEKSSASFLRALERAGILVLVTGLAAGLVAAFRKVRPPEAPPPAPRSPAPTDPNVERLAELQRDGAITPAEFERLRSKL